MNERHNISFTLDTVKVRKAAVKTTQVQRDRTKYNRKEKHRNERF